MTAISNSVSGLSLDLRSLLARYGILVAFLVLIIGVGIGNERFLTARNWSNLLDQAVPLALIACGVTVCIITGIFDLSTGSMLAVSSIVAAEVAQANPTLGMVLGVVTGCVLGLVNAGIMATTGVNSFIGTLSTAFVFRGVAFMVTSGALVQVSSESFRTLGVEKFLGLKWAVWLFFLVAVLLGLMMARTTLGRSFYAVGGNVEAARLVGIRVTRVQTIAYVISGFCAGLAGVVTASKIGSASTELGIGIELRAITAAIVGGTSIFGGEGAVWRAVVGVMFILCIGNAFILLGIDSQYETLAQGLLILAAVSLDQIVRRSR
ncbi:MAG: ABC transporter permease [Actinomycetota bacterium]